MKLKRITKWSETSPGDVCISIYIKEFKEYSLISERVGNLQEHIACSWPIAVTNTVFASPVTYPLKDWVFLGNWEFYLIDYKDLVLYTHWPYKSKRFWELLEKV
jgi:hypothetical protein